MKILFSFLSIAAFYLLYWIGRSILISFIDETWTIEQINAYQWYLAGAIGCLIVFILYIILKVDDSDMNFTIPIAACSYFVTLFPFSHGIVILYNLIVLGCLLAVVWRSSDY